MGRVRVFSSAVRIHDNSYTTSFSERRSRSVGTTGRVEIMGKAVGVMGREIGGVIIGGVRQTRGIADTAKPGKMYGFDDVSPPKSHTALETTTGAQSANTCTNLPS